MKRIEKGAALRALIIPSAWAIGVAIPLCYLLITSLRSNADYIQHPTSWPQVWTFDNYVTAWTQGLFVRGFVNNVIVTGLATVGVIVLGSAAAYGISRWASRWSQALNIYTVLGLIVPFQLGLPTLYRLWVAMGLDNSLLGAACVHIGSSLPLAIFLYLGFLRSVPRDLEDAARIDGAGEFRVFASVVFPLLAPTTATLIILMCIFVWNDLIISVFFLQDTSVYTLPKTNLTLTGALEADVPALMASAVIAVLPVIIVFIALQRRFLSGLTAGAFRG